MSQGFLDLDWGTPPVSRMGDFEFVAFDFETTGLYPGRDRITEIGAVKFRGTEETGRFEALINPQMEISPDAVKVTGITNEMLADKPVMADVMPRFLTFVGDCILVAHNAEFDLGFLDKERERLEPGDHPARVIDTLEMARKSIKGQRSYSLQNLAAHLEIPVVSAHRALDDARVCMTLFNHCLGLIGSDFTLDDFKKKIGLQRG